MLQASLLLRKKHFLRVHFPTRSHWLYTRACPGWTTSDRPLPVPTLVPTHYASLDRPLPVPTLVPTHYASLDCL